MNNTTTPTTQNHITIQSLPLTHPTVMRWRNWHFGKVKDVSDKDVTDFVRCEHELRASVPSSSLDYVINAHNLGSKVSSCVALPYGLAVKREIIQSLADQYDVHPDIILIRLREKLKNNKNIPRYNEVIHLYRQQKREQLRGRI